MGWPEKIGFCLLSIAAVIIFVGTLASVKYDLDNCLRYEHKMGLVSMGYSIVPMEVRTCVEWKD